MKTKNRKPQRHRGTEKHLKLRLSRFSLCLCASVVNGLSFAQTQLEEVVVTATHDLYA